MVVPVALILPAALAGDRQPLVGVRQAQALALLAGVRLIRVLPALIPVVDSVVVTLVVEALLAIGDS